MKKLLELRAQIKKKKPTFVRQEAKNTIRLANSWRQPKGRHSQMRQKEATRMKHPSAGYRSPRAVRGLHSSGLIKTLVKNLQDLEKINPKQELAILSSRLGAKKKILFLDQAKKLGIKVYNFKDGEAFKKKILSQLEEKRKTKEKRTKIEEKKPEEKKIKVEKLADESKETTKGQKSEKIKQIEKKI